MLGSASSTNAPPPATNHRSWADEAGEKVSEEINAESSTASVMPSDTQYTSASSFEDLNLSPQLLKGLYVEMKFQKPTKIQAISLPMILNPPHKDLIAQAYNGSSKTTCFVLGMLSRVEPQMQVPQALCICPTKESAVQNIEALRKMGKYTGISSECAVTEVTRDSIPLAKRPPSVAQVVMGTAHAIMKRIARQKLCTARLKIVVFDGADKILAEQQAI